RRDASVTGLRSGCSPSLGRGVRLRSDQVLAFRRTSRSASSESAFGPTPPSQPPVPPASLVPIKEVPVTDVPALLDAVTRRAAQHDVLRADPTPDAAVSCSPDLIA